MVTLLTNHMDLDRARVAVAPSAVAPTMRGNWRFGAAAPANGGTTGLFTDVCSTYVTGTNHTVGAFEQTIKRPARHLGTRST